MFGDVGAVAHDELPSCDFHRMHGQKVPAKYEGVTTEGVRAFMCLNCFTDYGIGLGGGKGHDLSEEDVLCE